jgi:hypothetical protein
MGSRAKSLLPVKNVRLLVKPSGKSTALRQHPSLLLHLVEVVAEVLLPVEEAEVVVVAVNLSEKEVSHQRAVLKKKTCPTSTS